MKERQAPEGSWVYRSWTTPTRINSRFNCRFDGESLIKRPLFRRDNAQSAIQTLVPLFSISSVSTARNKGKFIFQSLAVFRITMHAR